jgi:zinc protease
MKSLLLFLITFNVFANYLDDNLVKDKWNDIEIIWLEDNSFPTYDISILFERGAFDDPKGLEGLTSLALNLITLGTNRFDQEHILDTLEYYGVNYGASAIHEYSTFNVSGLVKDLAPTMKMMCHLFTDSIYPKKELGKALNRLRSGQRNMINNHRGLASYIARIISLRKTGYERSATGNLKSYGRINSDKLMNKLAELNTETRKRIYIRGPKEVKALENIIKNDCGWSNKDIEEVKYPIVKRGMNPNAGGVFLVPVKDANQAQIQITNYMSKEEVSRDYTLTTFSSKFIGGGFTSRLMQVLRVNNGLTYSAGSFASEQMNYGRKGIVTFTKNETLVKTLKMIEEVVNKNSTAISKELVDNAKIFVKGNYLYELESSSSFLGTLQYYDTINRSYEDIYKFPKEVDGLTTKQVQNKIKELFGDQDSVTVIVGNKSLEKDLKKAGYKVKIINAKDYL